MPLSNKILNILSIGVLIFIPHSGLIPNFLYSIPLLLFTWLILRYSQENFESIGFKFKLFKINTIAIGIISAIVIICFMQLMFFPILESFFEFHQPEVDIYEFLKTNKWNYIFLIIMGWVIGGFYEEIVFHGFIFTRLEKMIPGNYSLQLSFVLTNVVFGMYHYQLGILGLINALIVGMAYNALMLYFNRNLWYSIICHGTYNTMILSLIYFDYL